MVQLQGVLIALLILVGAASAQIPEDAIKSKILGVRYSPLAEAARVQGSVHISFNAGLVTLLSGPPVLAQTALQSAKAIGSILDATDLDLTYHFVLVDTTRSVPTSMTVKRGSALRRTILWMFGSKTEKVVVN